MKTIDFARAALVALTGLAMAGTTISSTTPAFADIKDYEFQLAQPTVQVGNDRVFTVRLLNKKTGKAVPDAVIFATRLDMAPDAMEEMVTKVTPVAASEPGSYSFKARFSMEGRWQFSVGAKVQGETGTVDTKLIIAAQK